MASANLYHLVRSALRMVLDVIFPPACPSCRVPVYGQGNLCPTCFQKLRMIADPQCDCCGIPFEVPMGEGALCPDCLEQRPRFRLLRAAMVYDGISAPLVSALKFGDQWEGIPRYAQMMATAGKGVLTGADMLIPIPLHWRRLLRRKFNQSALLAYAVSKATGIPCHPEWLCRVRATKPQMTLTRKERATNVKRAFAVDEVQGNELKGKTVVLVDDVVTSGATVNACAEVLLAAGVGEVRVLALARTVRD